MDFKQWIYNEIAELAKPVNKVTRRNVIKNPGSNTAHEVIQYSFRTKIGNVVKIQLTPKDDQRYDVVFYVNDTMDDSASVQKGTRDPEILSGVFHTLLNKADKLNANALSFTAISSPNDNKIARNLDYEQLKPQVMHYLEALLAALKSYIVKLIPPDELRINLWAKLGRGVPPPRKDINTEYWITRIQELKQYINTDQRIDQFIHEFEAAALHGKNSEGNLQLLNFDLNSFVNSLKKLNLGLQSRSPEGVSITVNRRAEIYKRLVYRYFADKWNIHIDNNYFTLTRK